MKFKTVEMTQSAKRSFLSEFAFELCDDEINRMVDRYVDRLQQDHQGHYFLRLKDNEFQDWISGGYWDWYPEDDALVVEEWDDTDYAHDSNMDE
jgi:hypothetical protein